MAAGNKEDVKSFWVWAQIEEGLHTSLLEVSTMTGKHPRQIVEMGVELAVAHFVEIAKKNGSAIPDRARLQSLLLEDRNKQLMVNQVKIMAYNHSLNPSEESADRLAEACDLAGVSLDALMDEIESKPELVEAVSKGGSLSSAEVFLIGHMKPGKMYAAREIIELAATRGFKEYVIKEAKRKQNVKSIRLESAWFWTIPVKEEKGKKEEEDAF